MSGLGRVPSFEPDEETKAMIEGLFQQKKEEKKKVVPISNIEPGKRHRVRIPEAPPMSAKEEKIAQTLAEEELNLIHDAFLRFTEEVSDTVIYGHLYNEVTELAEAFQDMDTLLRNHINKENITESVLPEYEKMKSIRSRIFSDLYRFYGDETK